MNMKREQISDWNGGWQALQYSSRVVRVGEMLETVDCICLWRYDETHIVNVDEQHSRHFVAMLLWSSSECIDGKLKSAFVVQRSGQTSAAMTNFALARPLGSPKIGLFHLLQSPRYRMPFILISPARVKLLISIWTVEIKRERGRRCETRRRKTALSKYWSFPSCLPPAHPTLIRYSIYSSSRRLSEFY